MTPALSAEQIRSLLEALNAELREADVRGEVYVVGGAVMCLVLAARESTQDVDALFLPSTELRSAAKRVASRMSVSDDWLNDAAKGYLSSTGEFAPFLALGNLTVLTATPEYLLAMKCLAMRLGPEFHDEADVRYLLRYLNIETTQAAKDVLERFYPPDLAKQLRRASGSVALNTAEGMFAQGWTRTACYNTALREMREAFCALEISVRLGYMRQLDHAFEQRCRRIIGTLHRLSYPK